VLAAGLFVAGGIVLKGDFKLLGRKTTISGEVIKQQISWGSPVPSNASTANSNVDP